MFFEELEDNVLYLKNIGKEDVRFILKLLSNQKNNENLLEIHPVNKMNDASGYINSFLKGESCSEHCWVLIRKDTKEKVGVCGFYLWNKEEEKCTMFFNISPNYENNGYVSHALNVVLFFAMTKMKVKHIFVHIVSGDDTSQNIAEAFNFRRNGESFNINKNGKEYLFYIYELDINKFEKRN